MYMCKIVIACVIMCTEVIKIQPSQKVVTEKNKVFGVLNNVSIEKSIAVN